MNQEHVNYARIEKAIGFIRANFKQQPALEEVAEAVHLSPFHFQRIFREWAGVSPKKFMQYLSVSYAKQLLQQPLSLHAIADKTGLSGSGRLHDLFVNIEGMTPGEYRNGGENLHINYRFSHSPFGKLLVASTVKGVCHLFFENDKEKAFDTLRAQFPKATLRAQHDQFQQDALAIFQQDWQQLPQIKCHLAGTPFQLKVWESLLSIPFGQLSSYGSLARTIEKPRASRAVGTAIGANPVAFLIPCHRVIQSSGQLGGYRWGLDKKLAILGWERAQLTPEGHSDT